MLSRHPSRDRGGAANQNLHFQSLHQACLCLQCNLGAQGTGLGSWWEGVLCFFSRSQEVKPERMLLDISRGEVEWSRRLTICRKHRRYTSCLQGGVKVNYSVNLAALLGRPQQHQYSTLNILLIRFTIEAHYILQGYGSCDIKTFINCTHNYIHM